MQSLSAPSAPVPPTLDSLEVSPTQSQAIAEPSSEIISADLLVGVNQSIEDSDAAPAWKMHLQVFTSTFLTIFLAELGDKTQLTTLLMAAESHAPWVVFAGAGAALIATSAIGVWLGCWLAKRVSPQILERSVGILLLGVSALLVLDVVRG